MNIQTLVVFAAVAALAITIITVNMAYATSDRIDTKDPLQNYNQSSAPAPTEEVMNTGNLTK
jgi:hypothetical protein